MEKILLTGLVLIPGIALAVQNVKPGFYSCNYYYQGDKVCMIELKQDKHYSSRS